jgi:hypothetical protein
LLLGLQSVAEPGTVLITDTVHRLVSGLFVVESRGAPAVKGIERQLRLYQVVQPSGVRGGLGAAAAVPGLTTFVGREHELRSLMTRWERGREGEGQVTLLIGEAGIGKSRLLQRFHELIPDVPHTWLEAAAVPFFQNTPFHAIDELTRQLVGDASLSANDVGQPFQALSLTGWKAAATAARATTQGLVAQNRDSAPSPKPLTQHQLHEDDEQAPVLKLWRDRRRLILL